MFIVLLQIIEKVNHNNSCSLFALKESKALYQALCRQVIPCNSLRSGEVVTSYRKLRSFQHVLITSSFCRSEAQVQPCYVFYSGSQEVEIRVPSRAGVFTEAVLLTGILSLGQVPHFLTGY